MEGRTLHRTVLTTRKAGVPSNGTGQITSIDAYPAEKSSGGVWRVEVNGSAPFEYFYLVDGVPFSPQCELSRPDGFGGKTCIYEPGL